MGCTGPVVVSVARDSGKQLSPLPVTAALAGLSFPRIYQTCPALWLNEQGRL